MKMGLREANQRFSAAIRAVKNDDEVILTERGKPIAVIRAINGSGDGETVIKRLEVAGLLRAVSNGGPLPDWKPRPMDGKPIVQTIREERDDS